MDQVPKVLVIDDDRGMLNAITRILGPSYSLETASTGKEGLQKVERFEPDLVLLDLHLPDANGMTLLRTLQKRGQDLPIMILTAYGNVRSAVEAIKLGAFDYLEKPFDNRRLRQEVDRLFEGKHLPKKAHLWENIIGQSSSIQRAQRLVEQFGPTDIPVLLEGETGTGKELFARAIHKISKRSHCPFTTVDCTVLPQELMESELFGYEKGAFTGAEERKPGLITWANGGTLFLDEVTTLLSGCQVRLLRLIEEQVFRPLGTRSAQPNKLNVRFVSATNVPAREAVRKAAFRQDLWHRLNGVTIGLPPLRERGGDVELLSLYFLDHYKEQYNKRGLRISSAAMDMVRSYTWPGNVRELQRAIAAAVIVAEHKILPQHLSIYIRESNSALPAQQLRIELNLDCDLNSPINLNRLKELAGREVERRIIEKLRQRVPLNQVELASFLGLDPKTLRARLREMQRDLRGKNLEQ